MRNVVPCVSSLSTEMRPPLFSMMPYTVESPKPVPLPCCLVVKKGSKIWACVSASIPQPVSLTASMTELETPAGTAAVSASMFAVFNLTSVGFYHCQARLKHCDQLDVSSDQPAQHLVHAQHHRIQIQHLWLKH